ncbi:unnamed protein product [Linum tenue]|uniref:Peptidase C1A papain C-terminal domain-containing protein n=1 Tax=Linum tenue TaxID=586396 RepID=A0AAV0PRQ6_9ROSI|nr:unnamed protein product [Linum tenue]
MFGSAELGSAASNRPAAALSLSKSRHLAVWVGGARNRSKIQGRANMGPKRFNPFQASGSRGPAKPKPSPRPKDLDGDALIMVDWREGSKGKEIISTPIQKQEGPTCYHHSLGVAIEAAYNILTAARESSIRVSIKELVDKVPPRKELRGIELKRIARFITDEGASEVSDYKPEDPKKKKKHEKKSFFFQSQPQEMQTIDEAIMLKEVAKKPIVASVDANSNLQQWGVSQLVN